MMIASAMIVLWVILALVVLMLLGLILVYNALVQKRIRCDEAWSQIDVQLKRRCDLIPNLVETVKGYAAHERGTLGRSFRPATPPSPPKACSSRRRPRTC